LRKFISGLKAQWNFPISLICPEQMSFPKWQPFKKILLGGIKWSINSKMSWANKSPNFCGRFTNNMVLGLILIALGYWLYDYPLLTGAQDEAIDRLMVARKGIIPPFAEKSIPHLVFLDIDDNTHQAWGEPMFTPRNRLMNLIDAAVRAKARLIIVDVDLSRKTPLDGLEPFTKGLQLHPYDQALSHYLENYRVVCACKKAVNANCPPIILSSSFNTQTGFKNRSIYWRKKIEKM
jgi:CHASE2 domain-containing sensor protein